MTGLSLAAEHEPAPVLARTDDKSVEAASSAELNRSTSPILKYQLACTRVQTFDSRVIYNFEIQIIDKVSSIQRPATAYYVCSGSNQDERAPEWKLCFDCVKSVILPACRKPPSIRLSSLVNFRGNYALHNGARSAGIHSTSRSGFGLDLWPIR